MRPQCARCNIHNGGQQYIFGVYLNNEREGLADEIEQKSRQIVKFTDKELIEMTDGFRRRVKKLLD